jgi:hypothetical protein
MLLLYGHKKSVESFLVILFPEALVNPLNENKQATPTPNMKCHQTEQSTRDALRRDIHIPKGVYCLLVLGLVRNLPDFRKPKQTLINAFNMSAKQSSAKYTFHTLCAAKVHFFFCICKIFAEKFFFGL